MRAQGRTGAGMLRANSLQEGKHDPIEEENRGRGAESSEEVQLVNRRKGKGKLTPQVCENREQRISRWVSDTEGGGDRRELTGVREGDRGVCCKAVDHQRYGGDGHALGVSTPRIE